MQQSKALEIMRHAVGYSDEGKDPPWPLERTGILRFDSNRPHCGGYFWVFAPTFNRYAVRDAGIDITSINVMFILKRADLEELIPILRALQNDLEKRPRSWRVHLGEVVHPGGPPVPLNPLLFRSRALTILSMLRNLVESALCHNKLLVYGNGVCFRHLVGAVLPEGCEEYS